MSKVRNWWWHIDRIKNFEAHMHAMKRTVFHELTEFQEVGIYESAAYGKVLILDGDMQSAQADEFIYHECLVQPAMMSVDNPKRVLILGGGEGATLREVLRVKTVEEAVMVDIDGRLTEICKDYLPEWSDGAFENSRAKLYVTDALAWMEQNPTQFDVIIGDLTDPLPYSPSSGLYSLDYFKLVKKNLAPGGIFAMQSSRLDFDDIRTHCIVYNMASKVFPIASTAMVYIPSYDMEWSFTCFSESVDVKHCTEARINQAIAERVIGDLRFYDGESHMRIFSLPKYVRQQREQFEISPSEGEDPSMFNAPFYII